MESHKRILGILYIVSGTLQLLIMALLAGLLPLFLQLVFEQGEVKEEWVLAWLIPFIQWISAFVIILFSIPSIIGGWGVLNQKKWGMTLVLVMGCFKLFSFPIGTALGIYTIWVYSEDQRKPQPA